MKKIILSTLLSVFLTGFMFGQLSFYTENGGKKITQGNLKLDDIQVVFPIESSYLNHDQVQFSIAVSPNSEYKTLAVYSAQIKSDQLKGKKEVKLWLKRSGGNSDFKYGYQVMDINWPANDRKRTQQIWNLSLKVHGMDVTRYEYKDDGYGNVKKEPVYNLTLLKNYPDSFPYDYGVVEQNYFSNDKLFAVKKSYTSKENVNIRSTNKDIDVNRDKNKDMNNPLHQKLVIGTVSSNSNADASKDMNQIHLETEASNGSVLHFSMISFPTSKLSLEETKLDLVNYLKYYANRNNTTAVNKLPKYMVKWEMELGKGLTYFYPGYGVKLGKTGDNKAALAKYGEEPLWEKQDISGKNFEILRFSGIFDGNSSSYNSSDPLKRMYVKEGKIEEFKTLSLIVGEYNGRVYVIAFYDKGRKSGLSDSDINFFQEVISNVTIK